MRDTMTASSRQSCAGLGRVPIGRACHARLRRVRPSGRASASSAQTPSTTRSRLRSADRSWPASMEDIDLLLDARGGLTFVADEEALNLADEDFKRVDASFDRSKDGFGVNRDGYLVDLAADAKPAGAAPDRAPIRKTWCRPDRRASMARIPHRSRRWRSTRRASPSASLDPRVWAVHKFGCPNAPIVNQATPRRRPGRGGRGAVANYLTHLPFEAEQLRCFKEHVPELPIFRSNDGSNTGTSRTRLSWLVFRSIPASASAAPGSERARARRVNFSRSAGLVPLSTASRADLARSRASPNSTAG